MNERVRKALIFLTLPAAVIWGIYNYPSDKTQSAPVTENPLPQPDSVVTASPAAPQPDSRQINVAENAEADWGRDPFRCFAVGSKAAPSAPQQQLSWILKGIIYNTDAPVAYINNRQVRIGDVVNQARVKEINRSSVILDHNGRQIQLTVNKG
jgi:type II secretory pathway component PulC